MIRIVILLILILFLTPSAFAGLEETLPSWHWTYPVIEALQSRGGFLTLNPLNRPYTRGEVASALIDMRRHIEAGEWVLTPSDRRQFVRLFQEFKEEIQRLTGKTEREDVLLLGTRLEEVGLKEGGSQTKLRGIYRVMMGASPDDRIFIQNTMNFDQTKGDDPLYVGKKWRGIVGYTEQTYLSFRTRRFRFKFGRDFLRWGYGRSGTLLFSDVCRPLDQFVGTFDVGPFRFSSLTAVLDRMAWSDSTGSGIANRYLSAHRVDLSLLGGRLRLAVSEAILYGGNHRSLDWVYVNPFMIYHGEQMNQKDQANTLGTIDVLWHPSPRVRLYGSLLIDDIQVEKTGPGDLEPNEIGWIIGSEWADPFQMEGVALFGEWARVTNRTYKTPTPWETFLFRNEPLGHPLGNDFDTWRLGLEKWFGASFFIQATYLQTRKGEGSLFTPWDAPWMSRTVEEGYSEPYLTGVVERRRGVALTVRYLPSPYWGVEGALTSTTMKNHDHVLGADRRDMAWRLGAWFLGNLHYGWRK